MTADSAVRFFAGYEVLSDMALPALRGSSAARPQRQQLRIQRLPSSYPHANVSEGWRHAWLNEDGSVALQLAICRARKAGASKRYLLNFPEQGEFLLDPASRSIQIDVPSTIPENTIEHLLLDQAIPRLLAGRGHLVVHASIVRCGTRTVAFLGRSGWGKSTLAALLHEKGYPAICDDCALLEPHVEQILATPSYPGLRLHTDSIQHTLGSATAGTVAVSDYSSKQRIIDIGTPAALLDPQPLAAIYLLGDPTQAPDLLSIEPINEADACIALIEHSFRLDPTDPAETVQQLAHASAVTRTTPMFTLRYKRDFSRQNEIIERVLQHQADIAGNHGT